ncbi:acetylhydrolase [Accumulibacter sp.]|uniref:alpha/beta hydrolase family protein n=1 Tax=Accumulibacter sp. TaxID=2053492 RepID=UPI0025FA08B1|nr:acetylhydrolase [Accumulibacter sp.]MCM8613416.1 acetylhydrolase [Accumulibacter sp.]MCM8637152.1 acetylhydrolase [Accumulibacter sp.]MCM8640804.1 acetylhydrolase [Accumulibacter sp.]
MHFPQIIPDVLTSPQRRFGSAGRRCRAHAAAVVAALALLFAPWPSVAEAPRSAEPSAGIPVASPQAAGVAPGAAAELRTVDFDWFDEARQRPVPVRLYLPPTVDQDRALPLVVFSHGMGGSRRGYSYLGAYWASQGYASLHLQHVGSDRALWVGNVFGLVSRLHAAASEEEAVARVGDLRFALDRLLADPELGTRVDATRIVGAGHSYGANTILLAIGARVERDGRVVDLADPRLAGAILISAPPFYGESDLQRIVAGVRVPTLHVTATEDDIRIPGYYSGVEDRISVFEAMPGARKVLAVFAGGSHSMFTDRAATGGLALNAQVKAATRELSLAFLRSVFGDDGAALRDWPQRYDGIVARFVASGS